MELFAAQHGVIGRRQALAAGLTPRIVEWHVRNGTWTAVHRGVYRLSGTATTWRQRVMAACLAAGPGAVASHRAAGALWGLDGVVEGRPEITVATSGGREPAGVVVHHTRGLQPADRASVDGIPCTSAARTLVDLAGVLTPDQLEVALDSALRDRLTAAGYLQRRLADAGRKGAGVLRELVEDRAGQRPHESPK
ncbi:MAG: type IV toxin-antitoxin system AbiEi family antitoxin domain-containing protein, partial [Actinobacteria bacterium]|nr:type IV toxin-antitoxin system AbiEi family antitoxin domain-containing protein [Actinomycetota bacterium]